MAHLNNKRRSYDMETGAADDEKHELQPKTAWSNLDDDAGKNRLALGPPPLPPSGPRVRLSPLQYVRSVPGRIRSSFSKDCCLGCLKDNLKVLLLILAIFAGTGKFICLFTLCSIPVPQPGVCLGEGILRLFKNEMLLEWIINFPALLTF